MLDLIGMLLVGLAAGWIASRIMKSGERGVLGMLVVGVVGSYVGGFLINLLGFKAYGLPGTLITAVLGAILCIWIYRRLR